MKKYSSFCYFVLSMTFMINFANNNNAYAKEYKSTYGNYSMNIPENTIPISEGSTSYRFAQGNINVECNIISLPPELQMNEENKSSNDKIIKLDNLLLSSIADINYQNTNSSWQKYKNKELLYQIFENKLDELFYPIYPPKFSDKDKVVREMTNQIVEIYEKL